MTNGEYVSSRLTMEQITQCYRMLNHNDSVIVLCESNSQSVLLKYLKLSTNLDLYYKFSLSIKILDMADVYNYNDKQRILFVGQGSSISSAYIAKSLINHIDIHKDIYNDFNSSISESATIFETIAYAGVRVLYQNSNFTSDTLGTFTFNDIQEDMPGAYVVAVYMNSAAINNLYYDNLETFLLNSNCLVNSRYASIDYQILDSNDNTVDWAQFDPATSQFTVTPPYHSQNTTVNLTLRSTITYADTRYDSSDSEIDRTIVLNIVASDS